MNTAEEMRKNAKYVLFPSNYIYKNFEKLPKETIKLPIIENSCYGGEYRDNGHHFKPDYHINYVLPTLEELLKFGYKQSDFDIVHKEEEGNDISSLYPKQEMLFDLYDFNNNTIKTDQPFSELRNGNGYTGYHRLFTFYHSISKIVNKSIDNNRCLYISCDSQMIPDIPVLCCYFKTIYTIDNRQHNFKIKEKLKDDVTDVLICAGWEPETSYLDKNFE